MPAKRKIREVTGAEVRTGIDLSDRDSERLKGGPDGTSIRPTQFGEGALSGTVVEATLGQLVIESPVGRAVAKQEDVAPATQVFHQFRQRFLRPGFGDPPRVRGIHRTAQRRQPGTLRLRKALHLRRALSLRSRTLSKGSRCQANKRGRNK